MLSIEEESGGIVRIEASGKLEKADYERFEREFERIAQGQGPLRVLVEFQDFEGWEVEALWEDLKFETRHMSDMGRVAVVGEQGWEEWATRISQPFFRADMRFFERGKEAEARTWLQEA